MTLLKPVQTGGFFFTGPPKPQTASRQPAAAASEPLGCLRAPHRKPPRGVGSDAVEGPKLRGPSGLKNWGKGPFSPFLELGGFLKRVWVALWTEVVFSVLEVSSQMALAHVAIGRVW